MLQYRPRPYPGRVILFRAQELLRDTPPDQKLGWTEWVTAKIEAYGVPGNHYTMLRQPFIPHLAQQLQICIDRVQVTEATLEQPA